MEKQELQGPDPPTFEQALADLEAIVHDLEEGQLGLDEALARYELGVKRLRHCHGLLERAERRIALVSGLDAAGKPVLAPLDDTTASLEEKARSRSRRRTSPDQGRLPQSGGSPPGDSDMDAAGEPF